MTDAEKKLRSYCELYGSRVLINKDVVADFDDILAELERLRDENKKLKRRVARANRDYRDLEAEMYGDDYGVDPYAMMEGGGDE